MINLIEIAKSSIYYFSYFFLVVIVYAILFLVIGHIKKDEKSFPEIDPLEGKISLFFGLIFMIGGFILLIMIKAPNKFSLIGLLWAYSLPFVLANFKVVIGLLPDVRIRYLIILLLISTPLFAFLTGINKGQIIKENYNYEYIISKPLERKIKSTYPNV
ncbi:MAG: hypothetical protein QM725_09560 [Lacibacter sp.]